MGTFSWKKQSKESRLKILVTGANGFVGSELFLHLLSLGHDCIGVSRESKTIGCGVTTLGVGDISSPIDWLGKLKDVDCVVHLAGRAHQLSDRAQNPAQEFDRINYEATMALVRQAARAGVKRFIYVSSIGVHGQKSGERAFCEQSPLAPITDYAKSKLRAEREIQAFLETQEMEWVIVRPPLVYSGRAPGNFKLLLKLVSRRLPLPFARVHNQRSMIALDNLVDFLAFCLDHPCAARQVFVISDGEDFTIGEIASLLAVGMGTKTVQFSLPASVMRIGTTLIGRRNIYTQLFESLKVDSSKARSLGWRPMIEARAALIKAGHDFTSHTSDSGV